MKPTPIRTAMPASLNEPWERVAGRAHEFSELVRQLRELPVGDPRREELEGEAGGVLAVLAVEARVLDEELADALSRAASAERRVKVLIPSCMFA